MNKLKLVFNFLKIKLKNIGSLLLKGSTAYMIGAFGLIQVASIVADNINIAESLGVTKEIFMQYLFLGVIFLFPVFLIVTFIIKNNSIKNEILSSLDNNLSQIDDYRPKIAVIPFENLNKDSDGQFLVDGIAEDLLTELSMVKEISVATRKTCFSLRDKDITSQNFKDEYGFDYVVTGSIRASENRIRISIELSDMKDDKVIWSNRFDSENKDIFDIQDEIVTKIVTCIVGEIEISSLKRANRKPTDNMTSYEYTLKGRALNQQYEKNANAEAIKMLDAAIAADKTNPLPHSWKACTIGQYLALAFREENIETIMINSNPETVSTDFDVSDKLYFEPIVAEDVFEIIRHENPYGVVVQFGGQTPLKLTDEFEKNGVKILGTPPSSIDTAENREKFKTFLSEFNFLQPENRIAQSVEDAKKAVEELSYPVIVRPSYVLGGRAMELIYTDNDLNNYLTKVANISSDNPLLIEKFLDDAVELDIDVICDGEKTLIGGVLQHIEEAGIHSGDSSCSFPPYSVGDTQLHALKKEIKAVAKKLRYWQN